MFNKRILYLPNIDFGTYVKVHTLAVAGGGGGGSIIGGGGGGGGYVSSSILLEPDVAYTVTIGAGGVGSIGYNNTPNTTNGVDTTIAAASSTLESWTRWYSGSTTSEYSPSSSSFGDILAHGGGIGASWNSDVGRRPMDNPGGSGGGGSCHRSDNTTDRGGDIIHVFQGHRGGKASTHPDIGAGDGAGGGGGGANEPGYDATSTSVGGHGGEGLTTKITGAVFKFGGGGGGGTRSATGNNYSNVSVKGGIFGGGRGGYQTTAAGNTGGATDGSANTGGGGGCGGYSTSTNSRQGGNGGSGVVIFRVPTSKYSSSTGSPTITTIGSDTIIRFNSSGTITFT